MSHARPAPDPASRAPSTGERADAPGALRTFDARRRPLWAYVWAAPTTAIGVAAGLLTLLTGGSMQVRSGVIEFHRAFARSLLESPRLNASAITLGHVILGRDAASLEAFRAHEHGHVRQAELLGPFFLVAYGLGALWAGIRYRSHYHANWMERDADRRAGITPRDVPPGPSPQPPQAT